MFDWPYYTFRRPAKGDRRYGQLFDETGRVAFNGKRFEDGATAELYLEENDIRGNVR